MKTRIVKIKSGLGNQMFQYAYARECELLHGEKILYDLHFFGSPQNMKKLKSIPHLKLYLKDFNVKLPRVSMLGALFFRIVGRYYSGYPIGYFREIRPQLLKEFSLRDPLPPLAKTIAAEEKSVAVHVRRGDYVGNKYFDVVGLDYFLRAAEYMKKKLKNPVFFVSSDDVAWVKENMDLSKFGKVIFVENISPSADMATSAMAKHHIITNSTFAWWCAWLNQNPEKIVVSPRRWNSREPVDIKSSEYNMPEWIAL